MTQLELVSLREANRLLADRHYLGVSGMSAQFALGWRDGARLVAVQVWRLPTSRKLPQDGTWLELSRWCLTPEAGEYAGSRMHAAAVKWLRRNQPRVTSLVSYSDPSVGHTGALYRACNWLWRPTWMRLRPPPSAGGSWDGGKTQQAVKDRWVFALRKDARRDELLRVDDEALRRRIEAGLLDVSSPKAAGLVA